MNFLFLLIWYDFYSESFVKNNIGGEFCHERNDAINQSFSGVKNEFNQCEPADNEVNQCELIEEVNQCELADKGVNHCEVADKKVNQCELTDKELDVSSSDKSFHFRLTDLCRWILGEDLDKREQVSFGFLSAKLLKSREKIIIILR